MRFYIKLRFTLCFKRGGLRAALKESAKLWPPLPQHTALVVLHCCSSLHKMFSEDFSLHEMFSEPGSLQWIVFYSTSWNKCSALNSGASLKRGRKFMTGISSRHESWQKIRRIPHIPPTTHISTPFHPFPKKPGKNFRKILCAVTFGADKRPWERCRETFLGLVSGRWLQPTLSLSVTSRAERHLYWLLKVTTWVKAAWDPQPSRPISLADLEINSGGKIYSGEKRF